VDNLDWRTPEVSAQNSQYIISYILYGIDEIILEIDFPSGTDLLSDIALEKIKIERVPHYHPGWGEQGLEQVIEGMGDVGLNKREVRLALEGKLTESFSFEFYDRFVRSAKTVTDNPNFNLHTAIRATFDPVNMPAKRMLQTGWKLASTPQKKLEAILRTIASAFVLPLITPGTVFKNFPSPQGKLEAILHRVASTFLLPFITPEAMFKSLPRTLKEFMSVVYFDVETEEDQAIVKVSCDDHIIPYFERDDLFSNLLKYQFSMVPVLIDLPRALVSYKREGDVWVFDVNWKPRQIRNFREAYEKSERSRIMLIRELHEERKQTKPFKIEGLREREWERWDKIIRRRNQRYRLATPGETVPLKDTISVRGLNKDQEKFFYTLKEDLDVLKSVVGFLHQAKVPEHALVYARDSRTARRERYVMTAWGSNSYNKEIATIRKMILDDESGIVRDFF